MPERWLTEMRKIGRMEPFEDLLERAERGPSLPEPGSRPATRMAVALFAVAIAVAGSWLAFRALTGTGDAQPMSGGTADFSAMWPETSLLEAQQVQALADVGDPEVQWRTDAATVAVRFAHVVLGWSDPMAGVTATDDPDTVSVSLHGPDASCQGAACSDPQLRQTIVTVTLQRLVRQGDGGIWSVIAVDGSQEPSVPVPS